MRSNELVILIRGEGEEDPERRYELAPSSDLTTFSGRSVQFKSLVPTSSKPLVVYHEFFHPESDEEDSTTNLLSTSEGLLSKAATAMGFGPDTFIDPIAGGAMGNIIADLLQRFIVYFSACINARFSGFLLGWENDVGRPVVIIWDVMDMMKDVVHSQDVIDKYVSGPSGKAVIGAGYAICANIIGNLLEEDDRIKNWVARRKQGKPAIDYFQVCDAITILKQTMEDRTLNEMSPGIGRIIPKPTMVGHQLVLHEKVRNDNAARLLDKNDYVVERKDVEINGRVYKKVIVEQWLQRGNFERLETQGKVPKFRFIPARPQRLIKLGHGEGFDLKVAMQNVSKESLQTLAKLNLTKERWWDLLN